MPLDLSLDLWGRRRFTPGSAHPTAWLRADKGVYQDAACQFTAADRSWLQIADAAQTGLDPGTDDFLWCGWFYPDTTGVIMLLVDKRGPTGAEGYSLYVTGAGALNALYGDGTAVSGASANGVMTAGKWQFIVYHAERGGNLKIYVGDATTAPAVVLTLDISGVAGAVNTTSPFFVSKHWLETTQYFYDGRIDSLMFFKAADLSAVAADIIAWAYNAGAGRLCSEITAAQKTAWGAVSGFELGENSGRRYDSWGSNHLDQAFGELVTNGTFTGNSTGWTEGAGWAYGTNNEAATAATGDLAQSTVAATVGKLYSTSFGAVVTGGTVRLNLGGVNGTTRNATGTHAETIRTTSTAALAINPVAAFTGTIDDVSVKAAEILAAPGIARGVAKDSNFAVQLDGASQYLSYTGTAFDPGVGDFSVGCAFYADRLPDSYGMLLSGGKAITAGSAIYTLGIKSNGAIYAEFNGDSGDQLFFSTVAGIVTAGVWYTLAGSFDRDGNLTIALNGGSPVVLGNIAAKANACSPGQLQIGRWVVASNFFPGRIDNAFYCNRLLSAAEITYLHNTGQWRQWAELGVAGTDGANLTASVIKGFWEFDTASALGTDSTSNGNDLTPQGTPTQGAGINYLEGMVSRWEDFFGANDTSTLTLAQRPAFLSNQINGRPALSGDGVDDYLSLSAITKAAGFCISAVVKCDSTASNFTILGGTDANDYIKLTNNTTITVRIAGGAATAFTVGALGTTAHVISVTRDATDKVRVYVDGTESSTGEIELSGDFTIAQIFAHGSEYLAGNIADLQIFDEKTVVQLGDIERYLANRYGIAI